MTYKEELLQEPKMTEGGKVHLPVAYPRTDLTSWISAYPQRFWITGRLRFFITHLASFARAGGHLAWLPLPYSTLYMSSGSRRERHHAGSHLTDLDRTSYRPPSTACAGLHELAAFSDGGDAETFPGRSRTVFRTAQIPVL